MPIPHKCPACNGHGTVSRPPWIPGDQETWDAATTTTYQCRACGGSGIVWGIDFDPHASCSNVNPCSTACPGPRKA